MMGRNAASLAELRKQFETQTDEVTVLGQKLILESPKASEALDVQMRVANRGMIVNMKDLQGGTIDPDDIKVDFGMLQRGSANAGIAAIGYCVGLDPDGEDAANLFLHSGGFGGDLFRKAMKLCRVSGKDTKELAEDGGLTADPDPLDG